MRERERERDRRERERQRETQRDQTSIYLTSIYLNIPIKLINV